MKNSDFARAISTLTLRLQKPKVYILGRPPGTDIDTRFGHYFKVQVQFATDGSMRQKAELNAIVVWAGRQQ